MLLRSRLAVSGARDTLGSHWDPRQESVLRKILVELTHDERVMGVAACGADGSPRAWTAGCPAALSCRTLEARVHPDPHSLAAAWAAWASAFSLPGGQVCPRNRLEVDRVLHLLLASPLKPAEPDRGGRAT
jgi:hypothetical protein